MPDKANGLPNKVSEEWGYPYLVTTRTETDYCACEYCEGHETRTVELPESEHEWKPRKRIHKIFGRTITTGDTRPGENKYGVQVTDYLSQPRPLFDFASRLGKP